MKKIKMKLITVFAAVMIFASCTDEGVGPTGDDRSAFTGNWTCSEQSKLFGNSSYPVVISLIGDNDSVTIKNFYQLGNAVTAIALISGGSMTIPFQDISGGIKVQGSGLLNNNNSKIDLTYFTNDAGVKDTVTATYSK